MPHLLICIAKIILNYTKTFSINQENDRIKKSLKLC